MGLSTWHRQCRLLVVTSKSALTCCAPTGPSKIRHCPKVPNSSYGLSNRKKLTQMRYLLEHGSRIYMGQLEHSTSVHSTNHTPVARFAILYR